MDNNTSSTPHNYLNFVESLVPDFSKKDINEAISPREYQDYFAALIGDIYHAKETEQPLDEEFPTLVRHIVHEYLAEEGKYVGLNKAQIGDLRNSPTVEELVQSLSENLLFLTPDTAVEELFTKLPLYGGEEAMFDMDGYKLAEHRLKISAELFLTKIFEEAEDAKSKMPLPSRAPHFLENIVRKLSTGACFVGSSFTSYWFFQNFYIRVVDQYIARGYFGDHLETRNAAALCSAALFSMIILNFKDKFTLLWEQNFSELDEDATFGEHFKTAFRTNAEFYGQAPVKRMLGLTVLLISIYSNAGGLNMAIAQDQERVAQVEGISEKAKKLLGNSGDLPDPANPTISGSTQQLHTASLAVNAQSQKIYQEETAGNAQNGAKGVGPISETKRTLLFPGVFPQTNRSMLSGTKINLDKGLTGELETVVETAQENINSHLGPAFAILKELDPLRQEAPQLNKQLAELKSHIDSMVRTLESSINKMNTITTDGTNTLRNIEKASAAKYNKQFSEGAFTPLSIDIDALDTSFLNEKIGEVSVLSPYELIDYLIEQNGAMGWFLVMLAALFAILVDTLDLCLLPTRVKSTKSDMQEYVRLQRELNKSKREVMQMFNGILHGRAAHALGTESPVSLENIYYAFRVTTFSMNPELIPDRDKTRWSAVRSKVSHFVKGLFTIRRTPEIQSYNREVSAYRNILSPDTAQGNKKLVSQELVNIIALTAPGVITLKNKSFHAENGQGEAPEKFTFHELLENQQKGYNSLRRKTMANRNYTKANLRGSLKNSTIRTGQVRDPRA